MSQRAKSTGGTAGDRRSTSWSLVRGLAALFAFAGAIGPTASAAPLGTGFTYQGFIEDTGSPAQGVFDLEFRIHDGPNPNVSTLLGTELKCAATVDDGLFTVTLDFGAIFAGDALWLEVGVAPEGPCDNSTTFDRLSPLLALSATPYALFALEGNQGPPGEPGPEGLPGPPGASPFGLNRTDAFYTDGNVGIGTMTPSARLDVSGDSVLFSGSFGSGAIPAEGGGTRFLWYAAKAAIRAGQTDGMAWDDANIGEHSAGFGRDAEASGDFSFAAGEKSSAPGNGAVAMGRRTVAMAAGSVALGDNTNARGIYSVALGEQTQANQSHAVAMGSATTASGSASSAFGSSTTASGSGATSFGLQTMATGNRSVAMGDNSTAQAYASLTIGRFNVIEGAPHVWRTDEPLLVAGNGASVDSRSNAMTLFKNGDLTIAGALTQSSDLRLKRDIIPLDRALERVLGLRAVSFHWRAAHAGKTDDRQIGLVAQEVEAVFPELVRTDATGMKSVNYAGLVAPLLEALKEQQRDIEGLWILICNAQFEEMSCRSRDHQRR